MSVHEVAVSSTVPYADGAAFGAAGPYELERGRTVLRLDPAAPANARITDLDLAPRDADGLVRVTADVVVLRPADPARRAGTLLYTVANRGMVAVPFGIGATALPGGTGDAPPPGDGFALRRGWTLAWSGWQFDVVPGPGRVSVDVPSVPRAGRVRVQLTPTTPVRAQPLADWTSALVGSTEPPYPAAEPLDQPDAVLTERDVPDGARRVIDRDRWRFARDEGGVPVPDPGHVWLEEGFVPGRLYEVVFTTERCPVVGCGLAAVRDVLADLREREECRYVIGYGASQSGRFLRQFLFDGMNLDERGRPVFDGVFCDIAGARRGEFNHRYALPSEALAPGFGDLAPFGAATLLERQRRLGGVPKIVAVSSSWEYWRGDAALGHVSPDGSADLPEPADVRTYLIGGSDHVGDVPGAARLFGLANPENGLDHGPVLRALVVALHAWIADGTPPPDSRVPTLADGTAVPRAEVLRRVAGLRGLARPDAEALPRPRRLDLGPDAERGIGRFPAGFGDPYPDLVPAVDVDGNETSGILLPENAVPLATRTGWNTTATEGPRPLANMVGSRVPFPPTADPADPRPALADRYPDRGAYELRVTDAARALAGARLLLPDDVDHVVATALRRYDAAVAR